MRTKRRNSFNQVFLCFALLSVAAWAPRAQAAVNAPVSGEIQLITVNNPADHWSGGTIMVGGTVVTIPRNLLIDLPANRLTLQQLYTADAGTPAACAAVGETGLAKFDTCNTSGMGAIATIAANQTAAGNVIAGDVLIEKGVESVTGHVTYIDYSGGYFRLNGAPANAAATGVIVRLNDPTGRHTVQQGRGCAGGPNCSADPRFTLDPSNYTNVFSSGYPLCIPSTVQRTFTGVAGISGTAQANASGSGDKLCPQTNRTPTGAVPDSRVFAPIKLGDSITAEGNFEMVNGVRFLSAHSTKVLTALTTSQAAGQPDYMFIDEAFIDMPGFQNQRARSLFIGFTTFAPADVMLWSLHYDPQTNAVHEFPLGSTVGCDAAAGAATCAAQGLAANSTDIFRIRHDVDFAAGAKARLNPCAHLVADPRMGTGICPAGGAAEDTAPAHIAEQFAILSPLPHEIQARTGRKWASLQPGGTPLITLDIRGADAPNGQYLFPFGINLGGIDVPNPFEFNLAGVTQPFNFSGVPWNLDRRLSPGGCFGTCESTPQPLDPFPFEGVDPRLQAAGLPTVAYNDPNFTASPLLNVSNRILSFVDGALNSFNGNATLLAWPPVDPPALPIPVTPDPFLNRAPVAAGDAAFTRAGVPVNIAVLANDTDPDGDALTILSVSGASNGLVVKNGGSVTYTPKAGFFGADAFTYTVSDGKGGTATAAVTVSVGVPATGVRLTSDRQSPQVVGTPVVFTATGIGGAPAYQYRFFIKDVNSTTFTLVQDWGVVSAWTLPTTQAAGTYQIVVHVRTGTGALEAQANVIFTLSLPPTPATGVTITPDLTSPQLVGTPVVFTASGIGGSPAYQYRFFLRNANGTTFTLIQDWSAVSKWSLPAFLTAGTYQVVVHVRTGTGAFEAQASVLFTLTSSLPPPPATGVTIVPDLTTPQFVGTPVVFTASGVGSSGYQYQFFIRDVNSPDFALVQDWSAGSTWTLPTTQPAGTYQIVVHVRTSTVGFDAQANLIFALN